MKLLKRFHDIITFVASASGALFVFAAKLTENYRKFPQQTKITVLRYDRKSHTVTSNNYHRIVDTDSVEKEICLAMQLFFVWSLHLQLSAGLIFNLSIGQYSVHFVQFIPYEAANDTM